MDFSSSGESYYTRLSCETLKGMAEQGDTEARFHYGNDLLMSHKPAEAIQFWTDGRGLSNYKIRYHVAYAVMQGRYGIPKDAMKAQRMLSSALRGLHEEAYGGDPVSEVIYTMWLMRQRNRMRSDCIRFND